MSWPPQRPACCRRPSQTRREGPLTAQKRIAGWQFVSHMMPVGSARAIEALNRRACGNAVERSRVSIIHEPKRIHQRRRRNGAVGDNKAWYNIRAGDVIQVKRALLRRYRQESADRQHVRSPSVATLVNPGRHDVAFCRVYPCCVILPDTRPGGGGPPFRRSTETLVFL